MTSKPLHEMKFFSVLISVFGCQMTSVHNLEVEHVQAITKGIGISYPACAATAATSLIIG